MAIALIRLFLKSQLLDQRVWLDLHSGIGLGSMSPQQHHSVKHFSRKLGHIPILFPFHGGLPSKSLQRVYICILYIYINICPILIVVGNLSAWFVGYPVISHAKESKNVSNLKEKRSNGSIKTCKNQHLQHTDEMIADGG